MGKGEFVRIAISSTLFGVALGLIRIRFKLDRHGDRVLSGNGLREWKLGMCDVLNLDVGIGIIREPEYN
jgi:hypothetical protein